MREIILASTSPRRKESLEKLGLPFTVESSAYEERMDTDLAPHDLARFLALGKAKAVADKHSDAVVVGADTFVVLNGELLGKPHTPVEAETMLRKVSGNTLSVITGFAAIDTASGEVINDAVETKIFMRPITEDEITRYVQTGEPLDKAGAFSVQGLGAIFVERIEGDFFSAMGLPLVHIAAALKKFGMDALGNDRSSR